MERKPLFRLSSLILLALSFSAFAEPVSNERQAELRNLLHQDCGSCHGMTLNGGLGPALTPESLKNKPIELLTATISEGRPGTPMPPWKYLLSDDEIYWLAQTLKNQMVAKQ